MIKITQLTLSAFDKIGVSVPVKIDAIAAQFSVAITPAVFNMMVPSDQEDPIAKQFLPSEKELKVGEGELHDPIGDASHSPVKGIIHRYPDRVLLKVVNACPVYCRFCFRREQVGASSLPLSAAELEGALSYIRDHEEIWEVILSGGDPLILSDARLKAVFSELTKIDHVKVLRIHTRVPVVMPERVSSNLVEILKCSKPVYILLHCNHVRELTPQARSACAKLVDAGISLLSQSVLLKGINDNPHALKDLMRAFVECRIKPHYIHHGDLARGTSHFRTTIAEGQLLMKGLRGHLSGVCQPTYILEIPGGHGKIPIGPNFIRADEEGYELESFTGTSHYYRDSVHKAEG